MEELLDNEIFDLEQHVAIFKKKKKFQINHLSEIDKILNSTEYSRFINSVYNFFNKLVPKVDGRLALKYYSENCLSIRDNSIKKIQLLATIKEK